MLAEAQWALIFGAAKKRGAKWQDVADVAAFKREIDAALVQGGYAAESTAPDIIVTAPAPAAQKHGLSDARAFFDAIRASRILGPELSVDEVNGCSAILSACQKAAWPVSWTAYAMATAYHETASTMQPIREYGRGKGRKYGVPGKHRQVAYGRGYVQLTWDYNYERMDKRLGLGGRLTGDYELALQHDIAADIMIVGMAEGIFTGKKLADYLPASGPATLIKFEQARRIINGMDKAAKIAGHALSFQRALIAGGWS